MTFTSAGSLALLLALSAGMFVTGGVVKGTLGAGLPLVVVPLLSLIMPAPQAIGLTVLPVLVSNLLQAIEGGRLRVAMRGFSSLMLAQLAGTLVAVHLSQHLTLKEINSAIALTVFSAVVLMVFQPRGAVQTRHRIWADPLVGAIAGLMAGISSLTGPILITYLMALRLPRDEFVGSISIIYLFGALPLYGAMLAWGRFGWTEVAWSCLALAPMVLGMRLGAALRHRLSEIVFRRVLLAFLLALSATLLVK